MTTDTEIPTHTEHRSRPARARRAAGARRRRTTSIPVVMAAATALLFGLATILSGPSAIDPAAEETRPVTVTGDPLPALPAEGPDRAVGMQVPVVGGSTFAGVPMSLGGTGRAMVLIMLAH